MKEPILIHNAKRCVVYQYGTDGKITIQKRFLNDSADDFDIIDALENRDIEIQNDSKCQNIVRLLDFSIDSDALVAIDQIIGK